MQAWRKRPRLNDTYEAQEGKPSLLQPHDPPATAAETVSTFKCRSRNHMHINDVRVGHCVVFETACQGSECQQQCMLGPCGHIGQNMSGD